MTAGKTAVVTGASSGIGAATVRRLLSDGWKVTGLSRRDTQLDHRQFTWTPVDLDVDISSIFVTVRRRSARWTR